MVEQKKILVAPLNWGLGHATRCVPVIRALLALKAEVIIGGDGMALSYLRKEFPHLENIQIPDLKIRYPKSGGFLLYFALRLPKLFSHVKKENSLLKKIVREHKIDGIISDNRYGLFHKHRPSAIITHQLYIETPAFKKTLHAIIKKMNNRFSATWVPDIPSKPNFSGRLSHSNQVLPKMKYIGVLSRFTKQKEQTITHRKVLVVLSGPEPFRTNLEEILTKELLALNYKAMIVRGIIQEKQQKKNLSQQLRVVNYLQADELQLETQQSEFIIARSGYSTIMDLLALNQKAILIPTPGQTEQEYLSEHLSGSPLFVFAAEDNLDVEKQLKELNDKDKLSPGDYNFNKDVVSDFLNAC